MINIVLVDDHTLLRRGLAGLVQDLGYTVVFEACNGKQFLEKLDNNTIPDIVLMDINMPVMDGYETTKWLKENHPEIKVLALSMYDNENAIIRMIKCGARGYIIKDSEPENLKAAIDAVFKIGYYYSDLVSSKLIHAINHLHEEGNELQKLLLLTNREKEFLQYSCTELTYKEIADKMIVSPRTVDGYRDALFEKLHIKTRVGLAIYAIRYGLFDINQ